MKHVGLANRAVTGLCIAALVGASGPHAHASEQSVPPLYDMADLVLDPALIGHVITVVEEVSCGNEDDCRIDNPLFRQVVAVHIRHIAVVDARRLIVDCHHERCIERMTGKFTGSSLELSSSTNYESQCLPALDSSVHPGERVALRCHRKVTGADLAAESGRNYDEIIAAYTTARQAAEERELDRLDQYEE